MESFTISTRKSAGAAEQKTVVSLNWDGASDATIKALARQALIVKWQGHARKHGIPERATIKVADHAPGVRHAAGPVNVFEAAKGLTAEEKQRLIAQLTE